MHRRKTVDKTEKDPETILIANPTKSFRDRMAIEKEFAKLFPLKILVYAFNTARGNIHLQFMSPKEALEVLNNWNKNCFGGKTQLSKANQPERPLRAILIRDVPTELSEQDKKDSIEEAYPDSTATRLVEKKRALWVRLKYYSNRANCMKKHLMKAFLLITSTTERKSSTRNSNYALLRMSQIWIY